MKKTRLSFKMFTTSDLKHRITSPTGAGGFGKSVKIKALKELIKRQKRRQK
jgi:hypothetical protein